MLEYICINAQTIILATLGVFIYWLAYGRFKRSKNISGPSITPFFGHYNEFKQLNYQLHLLIDKYYKESDEKVFSFFHYNKEVFVLKDNELIQQIFLKQADHFQNRQFFVELPWPCNQMITMIKGGATHKHIRTILSALTVMASYKKFAPHVFNSADSFVEKMNKVADKKQQVDVESHSQGFKMQTLTSLTFSIDCPNQSDFNNSLIKLMKNFTNPPTWVHQIAALPYGERLLQYIDGAGKNQLQPFIDTALGIVGERRNGENSNKKEDILQILLDIQTAENGVQRMSDEIILAQGIVLLIAVQSQTSYTLATVLYNVAKYQKIQEKIQKELDLISQDEGFPSWDHLTTSTTEYLDKVIDETKRINPAVFALMRECTKSCNIGGFSFEKGDTVFVPTYSIHRDESLWNDSLTFNPDRFQSNGTHHQNFYPFGIGPRMCTGYRLANLEIKVVLAKLLSKYTITLADPKQELIAVSNITIQANMTIKQPIPVIVTKR